MGHSAKPSHRGLRVALGMVAALAAVGLVIASALVKGAGAELALSVAASAVAVLGVLMSPSVTAIVLDALRRPTVHTRLERRGDTVRITVVNKRPATAHHRR